MKKYAISLFIMLCTCFAMSAQKYTINAVLTMTANDVPYITKDIKKYWSGNGLSLKNIELRDEDGNALKFSTYLAALAYMESKGWTIPEKDQQLLKYTESVIKSNVSKSFLLSKEVSREEWEAWIESETTKK